LFDEDRSELMGSAESEVVVSPPSPGLVLVTLNRPKARNVLNLSRRKLLAGQSRACPRHVNTLRYHDRRLVRFCGGADARDVAQCTPIGLHLRHVERLWEAIAACPKPVIAAVNGYALGGGCELAMHADMIVAGRGATFGHPEIKVGIMPGAGGTQRLARAIGKFRAMKMLLTGLPITGEAAYAMGLVSEVVDDDQVLARAVELGSLIAQMPPVAAGQIKEVLLAGMDAPLDTALTLERKAFQLLFASAAQKEGMQAFFDKRKPDFQGA
jgi:enoyl-CoA hydratase